MCWRFTNEIPQVSPPLLGEIVNMWKPLNKIRSELSSITDMSNLTSLEIDFPIESNLIKKLLEYFPDLSNLAFLKIKDSSDERLGEFDLCPQLLEIPKKLKTLKLDFKESDEPIKYLANFPKNHALKQLHLTLPIRNETELETMINLITHLQEAEVLCLYISNRHVWFHDGFYILLEKIFALEKLKRIQFEWVHNDDETAKKVKEYDAKNEIHFNPGSSLDKLLTKQPPLEVFKLNFVLRNANDRTSLLMNVLERGHWLRELELDVGKFQLNEGDFDVIVSLLKNLQQIEILKLEGFSFNAESKLGALIKEIRCYKKIKSLNFGEITSVSLEFLLEIVKSILLIPTIKTFNCSISTSLLATLRDNKEMKRRFRYCSKYGYIDDDETTGSMKWEKRKFDEGYSSRRGQGRGIDVTRGRVGWSGNWIICKIPWPEDE